MIRLFIYLNMVCIKIFLITGTIGTGKTSSAIYPFVKQFIEYNSKNINDKIGMLIFRC